MQITEADVCRARVFAMHAHHGQIRKPGGPYVRHPWAIERIVRHLGGTPEMRCAAALHDVREDCGISHETIIEMFGETVAGWVGGLTDISRPQDGNRAARKAVDREHTAQAAPEAKSVKAIDIAHNAVSITRWQSGFAPIYLRETAQTLRVLQDASHPLMLAFAERVHRKCWDRVFGV
jgi:(p)ppGpp synthase/HD superfamily hydrolase